MSKRDQLVPLLLTMPGGSLEPPSNIALSSMKTFKET